MCSNISDYTIIPLDPLYLPSYCIKYCKILLLWFYHLPPCGLQSRLRKRCKSNNIHSAYFTGIVKSCTQCGLLRVRFWSLRVGFKAQSEALTSGGLQAQIPPPPPPSVYVIKSNQIKFILPTFNTINLITINTHAHKQKK